MERLRFIVKNKAFVIETESTDFPNLRIQANNEEIMFTKVSATVWVLPEKELKNLSISTKDKRIFIFYGEKKQIDVTKFDIILDSSLSLFTQNHMVYGYVSFDYKLRFLLDQIPSAKTYYLKNTPIKIKEEGNAILLNIQLKTKYVTPKNIDLIISNRQKNIKTTIKVLSMQTKKSTNNVYETECNFRYNANLFINKLETSINYNEYNTDLFDYYLSFEINQTPITTHQFRIPFSKNLNTEIWCNLDNHQKYLFYFYPTINNKLSSKVGILNSDIYEYYVSLLKEKIIKNDKIILICEYPYKAQDNGFFFFKYLMEKQDKYTAIYMITDDSKDLANLKPYMDHVVFFKSKEHIRLLFEAGYLFHSHTSLYSLPFPTKKLFENKKNMKKIFLGHGITASKNIGYFYGDKKNNPEMTDIVIVSSKREKQQFHKQLHHSLENIKITGLARFDNLLKGNNFLKSYTLRKKILIMPTWRNGENKLSDEEFVKTKFFHFYSDLINNSTLRNLVKNKRIKIDFYLHNNFQKYNHLFKSDFVTVLEAGNQTVQLLLKSHGVMITDYSSVGLDFAIQRRKVLYYQFDNDKEEFKEATKWNSKILPGPVYTTEKRLLAGIKEATHDNKIEDQYLEIVKTQLYPFYDKNACQRIYNVLEELDKKND